MHTIAEIRIEPLGEGHSIRDSVERACAILDQRGLRHQVHDMGTNVAGELDAVLEGVAALHRRLHEDGATRLSTQVAIETRTDETPQLGDATRKVTGSAEGA